MATTDNVSLIIDTAGRLLSFGTTVALPGEEDEKYHDKVCMALMNGPTKVPQQKVACMLGHGFKLKTVQVPKPIQMSLRVWSCAAGEAHCLALTEAGHVLSWGSNLAGQCGRNYHEWEPWETGRDWHARRERSRLQTCAMPGLVRDASSTLVVDESGGDCCRFGYVAAVDEYTAALSLDGRLYECGYHETFREWHSDQTGDGDESHTSLMRHDSRRLDSEGWPVGDTRVWDAPLPWRLTRLAAGRKHLLALTREGRVLSWGAGGEMGVLGHDVLWQHDANGTRQLLGYDASDELVPRVVQGLAHVRVVSIAASACTSLAVDADGSLWGWGGDGWSGAHGSGAGDAPCLPRIAPSLVSHTVIAVYAFQESTVATTAEGRTLAWGSAEYPNLLGLNEAELAGCVTHEEEPGTSRVVMPNGEEVEVSNARVSTDRDGNVVDSNAAPDEPLVVLYEPAELAALKGRRVLHVCAGWYHALALCDDGACYSWGLGGNGALGLPGRKLLPHIAEYEKRGPVWRPTRTAEEQAALEEDEDWDPREQTPTRIPGVRGPTAGFESNHV